jgi:hypothetical protein
MLKFLRRLFGPKPEIPLDVLVRNVVADAKGVPVGLIDSWTVIQYPEAEGICVSLTFELRRQVVVSVGMTVGDLIIRLRETE